MDATWWVGLWLAIAPGFPAEEPTRAAASAATDRALTQVAATAAWLAAQPGPDLDESPIVDTLHPAPLEAEIDRALQRQLADFVEAWLREHGPAAPPEEIREALAAELRRAGVALAATERETVDEEGERARSSFDGEVKLAVVRPADDPGLLAIAWEVRLHFLGDASLLVFATGGGRVECVLEWSAELAEWPDLGDRRQRAEPLPLGPTGVLNDFDFRFAPRDERGRFVVATAWSEPSPHSSWGAASWALLAPGAHSRSPRVLARGSDSAYECYAGQCYTLAVEGELLTIGYRGNGGRMAVCNGFNASGVERRWRLVDGRAEELGAPAGDPFGFVSAWLDAPWREAQEWGARNWSVWRWHRLLRKVSCELELVVRWTNCEDFAASRNVVELVLADWSAPAEAEADESVAFFFQVDSAGDGLRLLNVGTRLPAGRWRELGDCDVTAGSP